jgi:hypothetical protein
LPHTLNWLHMVVLPDPDPNIVLLDVFRRIFTGRFQR